MEKTTAASILNDKNKNEQLTKYLILSLEAQKQGNPKQIHQIFDELLNEKADYDFLKIWLTIFSKTLVDSVSQHSIDCSSLIDFVLYKSKWLTSSPNHLRVFALYQKFCITLVSINSSYLHLVINLLIQNLVPREMYDEEPRSQDCQIQIGSATFQNLQDLKSYVATILKNPLYDVSSASDFVELDAGHTKFMYELLSHHPKAQTKLKDLSKILIGCNLIDNKPTKCFFVERESSEREDISYIKACNTIYDSFSQNNPQKTLNEDQNTLIENILDFLIKIFKLYPLSISYIPAILKDVFPHRRFNEDIQKIFLINILKLTIKFDKIRTLVLDACLQKLVEMDVELKLPRQGDKSDPSNQEMARKLDGLLMIIFDYLDYAFQINARSETTCFGQINPHSSLADTKSPERQALLENFFELLDIFQGHLLMTYQSKYVQFIFFYLCSYVEIYPELVQYFLSRLINYARDETEIKLIRINSIHYLRSALVRAQYIPSTIIAKSLGYLINYAKDYARVIKKKSQVVRSASQEPFYFEKIELNASSKYRERLDENSAKSQESKYKHLFQKHDIFYYIIHAIAYIFTHTSQEVPNLQDNLKKFTAILIKYNDLFEPFKFLSNTLLSKLQTINQDDAVHAIINEELNIEQEFDKKIVKGDIFLEEYAPYDPNFLVKIKRIILASYNFLNQDEASKNSNNINELILEGFFGQKDTIQDSDDQSDNLSMMSKNETDVSSDHAKVKANVPLKRMKEPLQNLEKTEKKLKQISAF